MKQRISHRRTGLAVAIVGCLCSIGPTRADTYTVVYRFTGGANGFNPQSLFKGPSGALFGIISLTGGFGVFKLDPPASGATQWTSSIIYSIKYAVAGYLSPDLVFDRAGNIYGGTVYDPSGAGSIFRLSPPTAGHAGWTATTLYHHTSPTSATINAFNLFYRDSSGVLFGFDDQYYGDGANAVFALSPPRAGGAQGVLSVLTVFSRTEQDGGFPISPPQLGQDGSFYGVVPYPGQAFRLTRPADGKSPWTRQEIYSFANDPGNGVHLPGSIIADRNLNLYGVATAGGPGDQGTVFRLAPPAAGQTAWTESILYTFRGFEDGGFQHLFDVHPLSNLNGLLFGLTWSGGLKNSVCHFSCGVLFKLAAPEGGPADIPWKNSVAHAFAGSPTDGAWPTGSLVQTTTQKGTTALFGVTQRGGNSATTATSYLDGYGTVYEYIP